MSLGILVAALSWGHVPGALVPAILSQAPGAATEPSKQVESFPAEESVESIGHTDEAPPDERGPVERFTAWQAPPTCVQLAELRQQVELHISADPEVAREVRGEILRGPAGWIATFTVYESDERIGERLLQLEGDDCRAHDETLALVVALLVEHGPPPPSDPVPVEEPPAGPEEAPPPEPRVKSPPPGAEPPPPAPQPRSYFRAGAGARFMTGWLPSLGWGPTAFVGVLPKDAIGIDLMGDFYLPQATAYEDVTVHGSGARVHGRACFLPRWEIWRLSPCAGLGWMGLFVEGREVPGPRSVRFGTMESSASLAGAVDLDDRWGLEAGAEAIFPFRRGRFVLESPGGEVPVHRTAGMILAAHVGVVLTL